MEVEIILDNQYDKPKAFFYTKQITDYLTKKIQLLKEDEISNYLGYQGREVSVLNIREIYSFYTENGYIYAKVKGNKYKIKKRLFELLDELPNNFVRISNSEIINFNYVKKLDLSLSGTIQIKFDDMESSFVSRRYVNKIKEYSRKFGGKKHDI